MSALATVKAQNPKMQETEIGILPVDWKVMKATQIGAFRGGNGFPLAYQGGKFGEFPFFKVSDMNNVGNEHTLIVANNYLSQADRQRLGAYIFPTSTIAFAKVGAAIFLERKRILGQPSCLDNNMAGFQIVDTNVSVNFIHYYLQSIRLGDLVSATALPALNGSVLGAINIPLPSPKEQAAIAEALSDADALIESLENLITKKRAIKQGAMQELLSGKQRLSGFAGEWQVKRLDEMLQQPPSYGINAPAIPHNLSYPTYLRITDITDEGHFNADGRVSVSHPQSSAYHLTHGDIVLARTGASTGKSYLYRETDGDLVYAGFLIKVRPNPDMLIPEFFIYKLQTNEYWNWVKANSMRSGQPGINGRQYASMTILIPPTKDEQKIISEILLDMDEELARLVGRLTKARQIKQGMMQDLLTGKVRLV